MDQAVSITESPFAVIAGFDAVEQVATRELGAHTASWQADNKRQELFLANYYRPFRSLLPGLANIVSARAEMGGESLLALAQSRHPSQQAALANFFVPGDSQLAFLGMFDMLVKWYCAGARTVINTQNTGGVSYPAIEFGKAWRCFKVSGHPNHVAKIDTTNGGIGTNSGLSVYLTEFDPDALPQDDEPFPLTRYAKELITNLFDAEKCESIGAKKLVFPMIAMDQIFLLSWLLGMKLGFNQFSYPLTTALMSSTLLANEVGFLARDTFEGAVTIHYDPFAKILIIDKPFLFIIVDHRKTGLLGNMPLRVSYVARDCWKEPKDLKF